jgi:cytochrome c biogenesis protein CcdA
MARAYCRSDEVAGQIPTLVLPGHWATGPDEVLGTIRTRLELGDPGRLDRFEVLPASTGSAPAATKPALALAGLADGINPCALAGLAFLSAYLMKLGGSSRSVLALGLLFSTGVFSAYFAAGMGAYFLISSSSVIPVGRLALYAACSVATTCFAAHAVHAARGGQGLVLGSASRRLEHALIHRAGSPRLLLVGAPMLGAAFAAIELACTGQVYLPALMLLAAKGETTNAVSGLVTYNLAFIAPPLLLTGAICLGGRALSAPAFERWAAPGRIALAAALVGLALFMLGEVHHAAGLV